MKAILINIALAPILLAAVPLIAVLSLVPGSRRATALRIRILDWLDQVTNDYGAKLVYLTEPAPTTHVQATLQHSWPSPAPSSTPRTKLIIIPPPRPRTDVCSDNPTAMRIHRRAVQRSLRVRLDDPK